MTQRVFKCSELLILMTNSNFTSGGVDEYLAVLAELVLTSELCSVTDVLSTDISNLSQIRDSSCSNGIPKYDLCILASFKDIASINLVLNLLHRADFSLVMQPGVYVDSGIVCAYELQGFEGKVLDSPIFLCITNLRHIDSVPRFDFLEAKPNLLVFLSRHASASKIPSYCVHTQGNWGPADLGGSPNTLGIVPVYFKNQFYVNLVASNTKHSESQPDALVFDCVHEATHHGPDLDIPAVFVELGSSIEQWVDTQYGEVLIEALVRTLQEYTGENITVELPIIFGIGGSHTCTNFLSLSAQGLILLGHVCPNYALDYLTIDMVNQAILKTTGDLTRLIVVVDYKSLNSAQRAVVSDVLSRSGVDWVKLKLLKSELRATDTL